MSRYIKRLIQQGEHLRQDFKYAISDSAKIARSLSAFANTVGGTLLIGVKDNGNIAGVKSEEEYYMVEAAATMYCKPEVKFETRLWNVDGKNVLEVMIPESKKKPVLAKQEGRWKAYIRVTDENILADAVWMEVWRLKKYRKGTFLQYSEAEQRLLDYLNEHSAVTLADFRKLTQISNKQAVKTIARLVNFKILTIEFFNNQFIYKLV